MKNLMNKRLDRLVHECAKISDGDPRSPEAEPSRQCVIGIVQKMAHELGLILADPERRPSVPDMREHMVASLERIRQEVSDVHARAYTTGVLRAFVELTGTFYEHLEEDALSRRELHHGILLALAHAVRTAGEEEYMEGRTLTELVRELGKTEQEILRALVDLKEAEMAEELPDAAPEAKPPATRFFIMTEGFQKVEQDVRGNGLRQPTF